MGAQSRSGGRGCRVMREIHSRRGVPDGTANHPWNPESPGVADMHLCHHATELVSFDAASERRYKVTMPSRRGMFEPQRTRRTVNSALGLVIGALLGFFLTSQLRSVVLHGGDRNGSNVIVGGCPGPVLPLSSSQSEDPLNIIGVSNKDETVHNSNRTLIFVGVMTAQKYLDTRAVAVYETWGKELPGRIAFFSSETSETSANIPLVRLSGVDDSYPPQKKSFMMLKYMFEQYGDRFEWFMRADDDVYVRTDRLEALLRSVNSKKPQFIGQAGRGNQEEFGLLSLEYDENFCMGGPGVIMSRETLARVAPHVKYCLKNLYTTHEDVELGRCVQKFARIPCTWSYEMQSILYHNSSGNEAFTGNLKQKEVHRAITLHPVKQYDHLYRIHNYMKALKIQDLQQKTILLHRDIATMARQLNMKNNDPSDYLLGKNVPLFPSKKGSSDYLGDSTMLGLPPGLNKFHPRTEAEVLQWDFISRSLFSTTNTNPRRRIESALKEGVDDVVREVMDMINMYSKQRGRVIDYKEILYGYHRVNPMYGADYILDLLLVYKKYRGRKMTVPVRRHAYLQQQFTGLEIREVFEGEELKLDTTTEGDEVGQKTFKEVLESSIKKISEALPIMHSTQKTRINIKEKEINFILPLAGRYNVFKRFMSAFEEVCLKNGEKVKLFVVLFPSSKENTINNTVDLLHRLQKLYPEVSLNIIPVFDTFARAMALELGAAQCSDDSLLFLIDVDMVFTSQTLERIRTNTIQGKQVYFPIVYSEFDTSMVYGKNYSVSPNHFLINQDTGYWRQYGFGISTLYKSDLKKVGGFDTSIRGWGKEDVDLFDKYVHSNLTIFRAADPGLVHVFHIVDCDEKLEPSQLVMCQGTRANTFGGVRQLAEHIVSNKDILKFAKKHRQGS